MGRVVTAKNRIGLAADNFHMVHCTPYRARLTKRQFKATDFYCMLCEKSLSLSQWHGPVRYCQLPIKATLCDFLSTIGSLTLW